MIQFTGRKVEVVTANQDFPVGYSFQKTHTWSNARLSSGCGPSQPHSGHSQPWWAFQGSLRRDLLQHQGPRYGQDQKVFRGLQIQERHLVWVRQACHGESETLYQDTRWQRQCLTVGLVIVTTHTSPHLLISKPGQARRGSLVNLSLDASLSFSQPAKGSKHFSKLKLQNLIKLKSCPYFVKRIFMSRSQRNIWCSSDAPFSKNFLFSWWQERTRWKRRILALPVIRSAPSQRIARIRLKKTEVG